MLSPSLVASCLFIYGYDSVTYPMQVLVTLELCDRPDLPPFKVWSQPVSDTPAARTFSLSAEALNKNECQRVRVSVGVGEGTAQGQGERWETRVALKRILPHQLSATRGQGVQRSQLHQSTGPSIILEAIQERGALLYCCQHHRYSRIRPNIRA
jgi:hypothetical protein